MFRIGALLAAGLWGILGGGMAALAVPSPDTVVVIANTRVEASLNLAAEYQRERSVPDAQMCPVDVPDTEEISLEEFQTLVLAPVLDCLDRSGALARVEAAVLMRGLPIRVGGIPHEGRARRVSLAAALATWRSSLIDGTPFLTSPPGLLTTCGADARPCYAPYWRNTFRSGPFEAGFERTAMGVNWRPLLVTMLHGRSYEDAARLLESALMAEASPPTEAGELLLMQGRNPARAVLDPEFESVQTQLAAVGINARIVPFSLDLEGQTLLGLGVGTDRLGRTIEGNTYLPGAIVDNLTSYGAVPRNFQPEGETQVSIARWVSMGVAGVHGTTDEPLSNSFPSRLLFLDYFSGSTLAEAYFRRLPFVFWQNLVLGDPMAAPFATRPEITVETVELDAASSSLSVSIEAVDPRGRGITDLRVYVDGQLHQAAASDRLSFCIHAAEAPETTNFLIVAQVGDDPEGPYYHRPKGWRSFSHSGPGGVDRCASPPTDAGMPPNDAAAEDAGDGAASSDAAPFRDAPVPTGADTGCGCHLLSPPSQRSPAWFAVFVLGWFIRRRR